MGNPFIEQLNNKNLCTWFLLPLLDFTYTDFGEANFIDSYVVVDENGKSSREVAVLVIDMNLVGGNVWTSAFKAIVNTHKGTFIIFTLPNEWHRDFDLFMEGRYTKLSDAAKDRIRQLSGLKYGAKTPEGAIITDARLMALERHPSLAEKWLEILGRNTELPEELLSKPSKMMFVEFKIEGEGA